jgi:hypothetical protein
MEMQSCERHLQEMTDSKNEEWNTELEQWRQTVQLAASQLPPMDNYHTMHQDPFASSHSATISRGNNNMSPAGSSHQQMYAQQMQRSHEMIQPSISHQVR